MKKIEFNQEATKAALMLIEEWQKKVRELRDTANQRENSEGGNDWMSIAWRMEAENLESGANDLRKQIESQNFNF